MKTSKLFFNPIFGLVFISIPFNQINAKPLKTDRFKEFRYFETIKKNCLNQYKNSEIECKNTYGVYKPKNKLDEFIIKGANYATKFVPLMNNGSKSSEYSKMMVDDAKTFFVDAAIYLIVNFWSPIKIMVVYSSFS